MEETRTSTMAICCGFVGQGTFLKAPSLQGSATSRRTRRRSCVQMESQPCSQKRVPTRRTILKTAILALPLALLSPAASEEGQKLSSPTEEAAKEALQDIDPGSAEPKITDRVFLDLRLDGSVAERVTIGLYGDVTPATVANFKALLQSGYVGTSVYRVVPGLTVQLGDVLKNGGRSGRAATADGSLALENVRVRHTIPGLVSMARGVDGRGDSRFFVNTRPGDSGYLDGRYCAFGRVLENMAFWYKVERKANKGVFASRLPKVEIVAAGVL